MVGYNELYEILRKEKYSEQLQSLPRKFVEEFKEYLEENKPLDSNKDNFFSESIAKSKKQLENAVSLFRELILKRKRKLLNLVLVATETGIMKRDYENMLPIEKQMFEEVIKAFEQGDKEISKILNGEKSGKEEKNKMIIFKENIEPFIDHTGNTVGPFKAGQLANLDSEVAKIFIQSDKAKLVDEN
jgi:DNA replication initiation complex subunit (GINS family)